MKNRVRQLVALAVLGGLAACSTPYQESSFWSRGGFHTQALGNNQFQISFSGNSFTSKKDTEQMALLRAAETVLWNGLKYFTMQEGVSKTYTSTRGGSSTSTYLTITGYATPPQVRGNGPVYDAQKIYDQFAPLYKLPKEPKEPAKS